MTKQRLYPFPRIPARGIDWGDWSARINGNQTSHMTLAEEWDSNSELVLAISVRLRPESLADLGIQNPKLTLTATCPSTAFAAHADAELLTVSSSESASAELRIAGSSVSQVLIIRTEIIGDDQSNRWLRRRILAEGPALRIPLDTELDGFPTSSYSFDKRGIPEAPWRLVVSADELEAPFAHSIRLELNEDFSSVRKLIDGKPEPHVVRELDAAIVRVLIATAARLSAGPAINRSPDEIAAEFPESIAAAAQRAAEQYLQLTLAAAVKSYRLTPERHEYEVSSGAKLLKD